MLIYNIGIYFLRFVVRFGALFNHKARAMNRGYRGIFKSISEVVSPVDRPIWIHCSSMGEFEQGRPVIEAIRAHRPEQKIILTFFSPSGYQTRKNYDKVDAVFYLPIDTPRNARRFIKALHPQIAIIVKYDFWLNTLREAKKSGCRIELVSSIFREDSVFFKRKGGVFRKTLRDFEWIFVQNEESQVLLKQIGIEKNVVVAGDTRFDRVVAIAHSAKQIELINQFASKPIFIAGSTWQRDEELIIKLSDKHPDMKFIIVPHQIDIARIDGLIARSQRPAKRFSECNTSDMQGLDILFVDTIGLLSSLYSYAKLAYIGGGFGVGIHNTLEAAVFSIPIAFGPNYQKFDEAKELISMGAAHCVDSFEQLDRWYVSMTQDANRYKVASKLAGEYVKKNTGATDIFMRKVFD